MTVENFAFTVLAIAFSIGIGGAIWLVWVLIAFDRAEKRRMDDKIRETLNQNRDDN